MLDVDHGTYPFVTSSQRRSPGGACTGCGRRADPDRPGHRRRSRPTRPGSARARSRPSCSTTDGERLRKVGGEFGTTTGRPRRCGWFDAVVARYATRVNGVTDFVLTKLDVLTGLERDPGLRRLRRRRRAPRRDADDPDRLPPRHADLRGPRRLGRGHHRRAGRSRTCPKNARPTCCALEELIRRPDLGRSASARGAATRSCATTCWVNRRWEQSGHKLAGMEYRQLGRSGLRVSTITLGTMGFGGTGLGEPGRPDRRRRRAAADRHLPGRRRQPVRHRRRVLGRPVRGDPRRGAGQGPRRGADRHQGARADGRRARTTPGCRGTTSSAAARRACAGSAPTTSTCTRCTSGTA